MGYSRLLRIPLGSRGAGTLLLPFLLLLLPAVPGRAASDPKAESARYFGMGNAAYDAGNYEEAVRMFRVSIALTPDLAGPQRRIGQALKRLGRCEEALDHYLGYLRLKPVGGFSDEIRQEMAECARESEAAGGKPTERVASGVIHLSIGVDDAVVKVDGLEMGTSPVPPLTLKAGIHRIEVSHPGFVDAAKTVDLAGGDDVEVAIPLQQKVEAPPAVKPKARPSPLSLTITPSGVRVVVDGKLVGLSPVGAVALEPGSHKLQLSKPGFLPEEHLIDVEEGQPVELELKLMRLEGSKAMAGLLEEEPGATGPDAPPGAAPVLARSAPVPAAGRGGPPSWLGWSAIGGGAACLAAGLIVGALALSDSSAYQDASVNSDRRGLREAGQRKALVADVLGGTGLALALGGVTLQLLHGKEAAAVAAADGATSAAPRIAQAAAAGGDAARAKPLRPGDGFSLQLLAGPAFWGVAGRF